ncbi:hypothetical protein SNEBB_006873 [Seison nebaliae]|nr:hypothetical protein SNEBB_006873 [Seison nebaliae]
MQVLRKNQIAYDRFNGNQQNQEKYLKPSTNDRDNENYHYDYSKRTFGPSKREERKVSPLPIPRPAPKPKIIPPKKMTKVDKRIPFNDPVRYNVRSIIKDYIDDNLSYQRSGGSVMIYDEKLHFKENAQKKLNTRIDTAVRHRLNQKPQKLQINFPMKNWNDDAKSGTDTNLTLTRNYEKLRERPPYHMDNRLTQSEKQFNSTMRPRKDDGSYGTSSENFKYGKKNFYDNAADHTMNSYRDEQRGIDTQRPPNGPNKYSRYSETMFDRNGGQSDGKKVEPMFDPLQKCYSNHVKRSHEDRMVPTSIRVPKNVMEKELENHFIERHLYRRKDKSIVLHTPI